jgi:hypothetical protein
LVFLGSATLYYQRGGWGKHFTTSCPKISVVLDHAQEPSEDFDLFWRCNCYCLVCVPCCCLQLRPSPFLTWSDFWCLSLAKWLHQLLFLLFKNSEQFLTLFYAQELGHTLA